MRRLLAATATSIILVIAPTVVLPSAAHADGSGVVTRNGRIGPLQLGRSTTAAVKRFAGRYPTVQSGVGEGGVSLTSYRYRCGAACSSTFYFDVHGRLANFVTGSARYHTAGGTRVGDDRDTAEDLEHKPAGPASCGEGDVIERRGRQWLFVTFDQSGKRVRFLAAAGHNSVLGC